MTERIAKMGSRGTSSPYPADLGWVPPPPEYQGNQYWRGMKENPLVPLGCLATIGALSLGLFSFNKGNMIMSQRMMKFRVLAQGGTIAAIIGGLSIASTKSNR